MAGAPIPLILRSMCLCVLFMLAACGDDRTGSIARLRAAADQRDATAQYLVGIMCAEGKATDQDSVTAYMWLDLAASWLARGDRSRAASARDALAKKMTTSEITEAQTRARNWQPRQDR